MTQRSLLVWLFVASVSAALPQSRAELLPAEVAVIAARGNRESENLANYYAKQRGIPAENVFLVDFPKDEVCARKAWTWAVRPEIQKLINEHPHGEQLRCLVTTWGVPLKVGAADKETEMLRYKTYLEGERDLRNKLLNDSLKSFDELAPGLGDSLEEAALAAESAGALTDKKPADAKPPAADDKTDKPPADATPAQGSPLDQLRARLERHLKAAQVRIAKMPVGTPRLQAQQRLQQLVTVSGGANVVLQGLAQQVSLQKEVEPAMMANFQNLRGVQAAWAESRGLIEQQPPGILRDSLVIAIVERMGGQLQALPWIEEQIAIIDRNESGASLDSELSLVMWPDDYQLLRWQPNYLRSVYDGSHLRQSYRTLMVSRIDAPSLTICKRIIDDALKAENEGLKGTAYFDGRGIGKLDNQQVQPGSYEDYDRGVLITARGIQDQTNLKVVTNDKPALFQPGECPNAALYCGWYSVAKYVDAFTWVPGAIAYHLASYECDTLHNPQNHGWCKSLLEDGVCATIGPVYEPYLMSFPRPEEFFPLLLQGQLTLVECYYRTLPFTSWHMTLIGDPLYRPFKNNPALGAIVTPVVAPNPAATAPPATSAPAATPPAAATPESTPPATTPAPKSPGSSP